MLTDLLAKKWLFTACNFTESLTYCLLPSAEFMNLTTTNAPGMSGVYFKGVQCSEEINISNSAMKNKISSKQIKSFYV